MLINYVVSYLTVGLVLLGISILVLFKNPRVRLNQVFSAYSFSIAWWALFSIPAILSADNQVGVIWCRLFIIGPIFIPTLFLHFVLIFLKADDRHKRFLKICYLVSLFFLFSNTTSFFIKAAEPKFVLRSYTVAGPIFHFHVLFFVSVTVISILFLLDYFLGAIRLYDSSSYYRRRISYLFWATLLGYAGGTPNYLLVYKVEVPFLNPFGTYLIALYGIALAHAILKYHLMDINIVLTRAGIFTVVYTLVLGVPFLLGYEYGLWKAATWIMLFLATVGPFIYRYLREKAENAMLKEQRRYQQALKHLSKEMTHMRDLEELLKTIVTTVVDTVKVDSAVFYVKDELYKNYKLKYHYSQGRDIKFQDSFPLDDAIVGLLYKFKRPISNEEAWQSDKVSLNYNVIIPCFMEDGLLGFLLLGSKPQNRMYTPDDMLVFETVSYSASLAIENCHFWKTIEDRQRKARLQEMDAYSYSLAHEIDNPMYTIIGQSKFLKEFLLDELNIPEEKRKELKDSLYFILDSAWRVSSMVKAIRDFGQPATGEHKPLRVCDVIESFSQLYFPRFKSNGISLVKDVRDGLNFIYGEKPELMQVLVILANNSIHALQLSKVKKIIIKAEVINQGWIRISFEDTGYGIKKEDLSIIFQSFVTTKASSEGTGMGLYDAKKIIERHKGVIWAESEGQGKGAVFFIDLPVASGIQSQELCEKETRRVF